ncbi:hypothetical protein AJ80_01457 [Polytolypa hystricis UAMH7299]|uniref:Lipocalin-like domain-containing protein n=1 Tax=Polytolypa hystricis (strain UAMH7299) TaxID=1447883 RepID=A0A2B7YZV4_POLH7|nr:hypothetical protein AJ80_01457 [Polytolypa hystricis UAMH7299]
MGKDAQGIIMYTPDGYMSAQLMAPGAPPFAVADLNGGTQEELAEAMKRYLAYSGRFRVTELEGDGDGNRKVKLEHEMMVSSFPNWLGDVQERRVRVEGEYLTGCSDEPSLVKGEEQLPTLLWKRMASN